MRAETVSRIVSLVVTLAGVIGFGAVVWYGIEAIDYGIRPDFFFLAHMVPPSLPFLFAALAGGWVFARSKSAPNSAGRVIGAIAAIVGLWFCWQILEGLGGSSDLDVSFAVAIGQLVWSFAICLGGFWSLFGWRIVAVDLLLAVITLVPAAFVTAIFFSGLESFAWDRESLTPRTSIALVVGTILALQANAVRLINRGWPFTPRAASPA